MKFAVSCLIIFSAQSYVSTNAFTPASHPKSPTFLQSTPKSGSLGTSEGWLSNPAAPVDSAPSAKKTLQESLKVSSFQKRLSLLGSTGSIGTQTLEIVDACPNNFVIDALSAGNNAKLLAEQVMKYQPKIASLSTQSAAEELKKILEDSSFQNKSTRSAFVPIATASSSPVRKSDIYSATSTKMNTVSDIAASSKSVNNERNAENIAHTKKSLRLQIESGRKDRICSATSSCTVSSISVKIHVSGK